MLKLEDSSTEKEWMAKNRRGGQGPPWAVVPKKKKNKKKLFLSLWLL
jgi:hypothetical protein